MYETKLPNKLEILKTLTNYGNIEVVLFFFGITLWEKKKAFAIVYKPQLNKKLDKLRSDSERCGKNGT